jgi:hypothetical protein
MACEREVDEFFFALLDHQAEELEAVMIQCFRPALP